MNITYRPYTTNDTGKLFKLIESCFPVISEDMTIEGQEVFFDAVQGFLFNTPANIHINLAEYNGQILGMLAIRDDGHICLFFVDHDYRKGGIGRTLLDKSIYKAKDVNSSICAIPAYERLGFTKQGDIQESNGIKYQRLIKVEL